MNGFVFVMKFVMFKYMEKSVSGRESHKPGTLENPIIDSKLTTGEALRPNPNFFLAPEVFERQIVLQVMYISFDGKYHQGQIVVDKDLENDVKDFFNFLLKQNFPLNKAIPVADKRFNFDDALSMATNNSSGFNPRAIAGTDKPSNHAFGRAIDINPLQNPYIRNGVTEPIGAIYNTEQPGTLTAESPIVKFLKTRGWNWGGDYHDLKDYHHFDKPLKKLKSTEISIDTIN
jgi:peptidoglycan LD-endopeptidase CwlK